MVKRRCACSLVIDERQSFRSFACCAGVQLRQMWSRVQCTHVSANLIIKSKPFNGDSNT